MIQFRKNGLLIDSLMIFNEGAIEDRIIQNFTLIEMLVIVNCSVY